MFTKLNKEMFIRNGIRYNSNFKIISHITNNNIGENIQVKGWIKGLRKMKENIFLDINDGTCKQNLQIVLNKEPKWSNISHGSSIQATGNLGTTPKGQLELKCNTFEVIGNCPINDGYPFVPRQTFPPEYIRKYLHLRSRVASFNSMLRVRNDATHAIHNYLQNLNYIQIHTPIITANDCEGAGEVFRIQPDNPELLKQMAKENIPAEHAFFDKKAFLTVSGQLHLESMSHGMGNCYTFGPTFRSENQKSHVHLSEFYMLEVEQCFVQSLNEVIVLIEDMLKTVTSQILNKRAADVEQCNKLNPHYKLEEEFKWLNTKFPIITYQDAIKVLKANRNELKIKLDETEGLAKEHELFLCKYFNNSPVFVVDWPIAMKPFYMKQNSNNPNMVDALDLLVPFVGELAGGSIREDNYDVLKAKLPPGLEWYLELRKFGGITTGGFGLGFERYLQFILNIVNIKDAIPFPRWAHNCDM